jgi:hypothetical protein
MTEPVPHPVLFNAWKHHAGWARRRIAEAVEGGLEAMAGLAGELVVVGTRLMDWYVGSLTPAEIGGRVLEQLRAASRIDPGPFADWLAGQGGYAVVPLPDDGSRWALRLGETAGRYVHIHPGRYSPHTLRVRADTLRTAVLALALGRLSGRDPSDVGVVNEARRRYLELPQVRDVGEGGLGAVIRVLASAPRPPAA